ncbi:hypothetical protein CPB83DRAFT_848430 [Crepidotus variabilis]|uniref:Zn(2)-C6 fungal-type domain-containing protein n=1 Tax=Crepidotus variabilis TaxID=179855 RepID=A0A9P6EMI2_9AGAR|nr:hypothetical protein CPB83DRAFT_848430 [Crepidotus variabilis]
MASKTEASSQGTLQRGKACLRCRKRKMRCDGAKPACQQCNRAKKGDSCEYDDGKGKTRTQLLRETIVKLEQRVKELEDPEYVPPAVSLFDPSSQSMHSRSHSVSSSSLGSPESAYISASHSPFPDSVSSSPAGSWGQAPSPSPFMSDMFFDDQPLPAVFQPPLELAQMFVDIFIPHSRQCGLEINMDHLRESLTLPESEQRHPVLMNAIYLWACFMSRPEGLSQHEDTYLHQTLSALPEALRSHDKYIDVIQASCLLSLYFLANGRFLEGSYHAGAAASLCIQTGMCEGVSRERLSETVDNFAGRKLNSKDGERILAFWQVFNLDRCWSAILNRPCSISDTMDSQVSITCPWPQDIQEYGNGHVDAEPPLPTIRAFLSGSISASSFSVASLRVKASALFAQADNIARSWASGQPITPRLYEDIRALEHVISLYLSTLIPIDQMDAVQPQERHSLIMAHTLANCATIHLHRPFSLENASSYEKCSQVSRICVSVIRQIAERDFSFLEPIIGPCWWSVADVIIRDLDTLETSWPLVQQTELRNDLNIILHAMNELSTRFPIVGPAMTKVQKRLAA